jgi:hypothetical protein
MERPVPAELARRLMMTCAMPLPKLAASVIVLAFVFACAWPRPARADPLFGWGEDALEDRFLDGDIDEEDDVAMRRMDHGRAGHVATSDVHGESWVSLVGFTKQLRSGRHDFGGFVVVGLALDRIAAGPTHRIADPPRSLAPPPAATATTPASSAAPAPPAATAAAPAGASADFITPALARACVAAALRASGLGVDDSRVDDLVGRARASAWLPEARTRAMRLWNDAAHTTTLASTDTANFYDAVGANLVLELRLTWRLDRLVFAGDEPTLERIRLERQDARARLATRTLEVLFAWQRAVLAAEEAIAGSRDALESRLRAAEAQATLDVLTGGWFSSRATGASGDARASGETPP